MNKYIKNEYSIIQKNDQLMDDQIMQIMDEKIYIWNPFDIFWSHKINLQQYWIKSF